MPPSNAWTVCQQAVNLRPRRRKAFIQKACRGDAQLQDTVTALLILHTGDGLEEFMEETLRVALTAPLPKWNADEGIIPKRLGEEMCTWSFRSEGRARFVISQLDDHSSAAEPYYEVTVSVDQACLTVTHSNRRCGMFSYLWHVRTATVFEFDALFERGASRIQPFLGMLLRRVFETETPNNDWPT